MGAGKIDMPSPGSVGPEVAFKMPRELYEETDDEDGIKEAELSGSQAT